MRDRRLEKTGDVFDYTPHPKRAKRRSFRGNTLRIFSAENDADACRSFAAVEWYYSDRLLERVIGCSAYTRRDYGHFGISADGDEESERLLRAIWTRQ